MTVYIVTQGEYSDYHIEAVFTNKDQAEAYCATHHRMCEIEEWDTDVEKVVTNKKINIVWSAFVMVDSNGRIDNTLHNIQYDHTFDEMNTIEKCRHGRGLAIFVTTDKDCTPDKAKKIMYDRLAQWKYENNM